MKGEIFIQIHLCLFSPLDGKNCYESLLEFPFRNALCWTPFPSPEKRLAFAGSYHISSALCCRNSISNKQLRRSLSGKGIVEQLFKYQIPPEALVEEWWSGVIWLFSYPRFLLIFMPLRYNSPSYSYECLFYLVVGTRSNNHFSSSHGPNFVVKCGDDSLVWNQYTAEPEEKNVGDMAYYIPLSKKVEGHVPCVPHLIPTIFQVKVNLTKLKHKLALKSETDLYAGYSI